MIKEVHSLGKGHWYNFLPKRAQYWLVKTGIKLGLIRRYGHLTVTVHHADGHNEKREGYNIITDVGIQHLGDILAGIETTNYDLAFMEPGSGTTDPVIGNTDTETPLTPADRLAVTNQTRSGTTPYEVVITTFVNSTKYTRPTSITELCVFFGPDETGDLFARGELSSSISLPASATATLTYGFVFR